MKEWQVLLSGSGGQGLGLAGKILAEAALNRGLYAAHSQSYGARARGGYSESGVVIGSKEIVFPLIEKPNLLLTLSLEAYQKNIHSLPEEGFLVFDNEMIQIQQGKNLSGYHIMRAAREMGNEKGATLLALGIVTILFNIVRPQDIEIAITNNLSSKHVDINIQCYRKGIELAS